MKSGPISADEATVIAVRAVEFILAEADRTARFVKLTGLTADAVRQGLADPQFLSGILDYLLADESLLFEFSAYAHVPVTIMQQARRTLAPDNWERSR